MTVDDLSLSSCEVQTWRIRDKADFDALLARDAGPRTAVEAMLVDDASTRARPAAGGLWRRAPRDPVIPNVPGYCRVCRAAVRFTLPGAATGALNLREEMGCAGCGLNNRQRFVAVRALQHLAALGPGSRLYAYEQATAFFDRIRERLGERAMGSEWVDADKRPGEIVDGIRHEDATALSFADASFDVAVSNDVFEHVPDIHAALAEACRVLRPGGTLLFTVPFYGAEKSEVCARLEDGELRLLREPEYHGDPVHPEEGSLVFYRFGWDLLDHCRAAGFADAAMIGYYSVLCGHIGGGLQYAFEAQAPA